MKRSRERDEKFFREGRRAFTVRRGEERRESGIKESTFPCRMIDSVILFGILLAIYSPSQRGRKINLPWRARPRSMVGRIKVLKLDLIASGIFL